MTRKKIRNGSDGASPQKKEAVVNPVTDNISSRLRPKVVASQPVMGRIMAFATRYDVSVQVASSVVAERFPAMCGSETLTTVVSSTSMKVLDMTAIAISQGLISLVAGSLAAITLALEILRLDHAYAGLELSHSVSSAAWRSHQDRQCLELTQQIRS